ncbi:hypothetical protein BOTNAR_0235g00160 [Botryotinia narcissicola]|uniref:Core Histone H2A/H2B/H3 domain-containing protein n=1 Tax=Botryotinia narcissicola TaxID=278944 RepID=A0A4Z1I5D3_9HELO|nr:hypothetical protein BOTNAR_0235g00160 [Botryotinia narcissicola]
MSHRKFQRKHRTKNGGVQAHEEKPTAYSGRRYKTTLQQKPRRDINYPRKMDDWDLFALHPKTDLIITKSSFAHLAREITELIKPGENYEIDQLALDSLQECTEAHLVREFEMATMFTARASRATIHSKDMKDAKFIRDLRDEYTVRLETEKINKMGETKKSD